MFETYATYCPEDDKLRLYVGRVPRDEYLALKAQGWKSTPKQDCDFVAVWTVSRENTALEYSPGGIEDEDQSPQDRAADRAERFSGYRDKRESEAYGHADSYDAGPAVHGHQSQALAERRAAQHGRLAVRAVDQWRKAEYWTYRTEGVIKHALYVSAPGVRMGRIKKLEAEKRRIIASYTPCPKTRPILQTPRYCPVCNKYSCDDHPEAKEKTPHVWCGQGRGGSWVAQNALQNMAKSYERYLEHLDLRLTYENQMLQAQGGRAAELEMVPGGRLGQKMITKVNKSPATGRVTSVEIWGERPSWQRRSSEDVIGPMTIKTERLAKEVYTPPTEKDLAELKEWKAKQKAKTQEANKGAPKLYNPTIEDAQRLQKVWNDANRASNKAWGQTQDKEVMEMTQAEYSKYSRGSYGRGRTVEIIGGGRERSRSWNRVDFDAVAKVREYNGRVIVLTDKPQKPLPAFVWVDPRPEIEEEVKANFNMLLAIIQRGWNWASDATDEEKLLFYNARLVKIADAHNSPHLTEKGHSLRQELEACAA